MNSEFENKTLVSIVGLFRMRKILALFFMVMLVARAHAQSNAPVRLALIAEGDESSQTSDILTVELSKNPQIKLLERNEIEKVYHEQGLSSANRDYLKLGQVLGADGLLLVRASAATNNAPVVVSVVARNAKSKMDLNVQLIAVRPGVLLTSERFSGIDDISRWAPRLLSSSQSAASEVNRVTAGRSAHFG